MLGVLVLCELEEFDMMAGVGEDVISLSITEAEFEILNSRKTPGIVVFTWEL